MRITSDLFGAFLKCPTKCWLQSRSEAGAGNAYADWVRTQNESYRSENTNRLLEGVPPNEYVTSPLATENPKVAKWRLAVNMPAETQTLESLLHAVERVPPEGRGKPAQFIPIRFVFTNKLTKDDRLLVVFDALVLSEVLGREVSLGKIIHGVDHTTLKVKPSTQAKEVRKRVEKITALLSSQSPPDLVLNRHCTECEFQKQCRHKTIEKDDLSLLARMSEKERKKFNCKGIFTVTQLSYTFRPRRRPKRMRDKREKYHHALKALAIREKKIHIVGSPELKIEGTPVYLDVEGLPDRDFYYLIGVRIGNGDSAVQHSLWADTVVDEGKIWREFQGILEAVEKPVLIHYGSYETTFINRLSKRYGGPFDGVSTTGSDMPTVNLLSVLFARVYFPTHHNGLKDLASSQGFKWTESQPSGANAIVLRRSWELTHEREYKHRLVTYNAEDCQALELVCTLIKRIGAQPSPNGNLTNSMPEVVRAEAVSDDRLQKWRTFRSPFPEFESIATAAHWNYQRDRLVARTVKPHRRVRESVRHNIRAGKIFKVVKASTSRICPRCKKRKRCKPVIKERNRYELFMGQSSIKVRLVKYVLPTYACRRCNIILGSESHFWGWHKFGWSLVAYFIYQVVGLNIPQRKVAECFSRLFGIAVKANLIHELKIRAAEFYRDTRHRILNRICTGRLVHADETPIHLQGTSGYVWVLTSLHEVVYLYSETREGELPQSLLQDFHGVLVTDFYSAYDSINCKQQKCLVHLIRDLNDEVLDHPYDEELKSIVRSFGGLLQPILESVTKRGLKRHFLRKHLVSVDRFYRNLLRTNLSSEAAQKCRQRFQKNRDTLFTFLEHDGIPWNNNNAEHAIKAIARLRNIITGVSTVTGLDEYLVLLSVCQTCQYQGLDFLDFLRSGEKDIEEFAESRGRKRKHLCFDTPR